MLQCCLHYSLLNFRLYTGNKHALKTQMLHTFKQKKTAAVWHDEILIFVRMYHYLTH